MRTPSTLIIVWLLLCLASLPARAAAPSDWPALNHDAAQSNANLAETALNAHTVLKLHAKWEVPIPDASYPIVAGGRVYIPILSQDGRIHVRALNVVTGKMMAGYPKDALGGMVMVGADLYLAGHVLQAVDPATGDKLVQINPKPAVRGGEFLNPEAADGMIVAGYASPVAGRLNSLYGVNARNNRVMWKAPSTSALAAMATGHVLTRTLTGSAIYDEQSGKVAAHAPAFRSDWFAGSMLTYTVASQTTGAERNASIYAVDGTGHIVWHRAVGPPVVATGWPHAVGVDGLYVQVMRPVLGVEALDPESGAVQWVRAIPDVQRVVLGGDVLYVLTYALGQPVRLIALHPNNGAVIGSIVLSSGYYAFNTANEVMVANGMVFLRVVGPGGPELLALGTS